MQKAQNAMTSGGSRVLGLGLGLGLGFRLGLSSPTTPATHHTCYYGIKENGSLSLDNTEICRDDQNLCVRITTDEGWEMRSCWDDDFNMEYSRPGCYKVTELGSR